MVFGTAIVNVGFTVVMFGFVVTTLAAASPTIVARSVVFGGSPVLLVAPQILRGVCVCGAYAVGGTRARGEGMAWVGGW